jgi:Zn-dependent M16 (insulinase) family peptidase
LSERDLTRFIIGTIGDYDAPMSVSSKSRVSNVYYFQNITQKDLQKIREEILAAKMEDLNSFADTLDAVNEQNIYCVIGNEESLADNSELFKKIIKIN